MNDLPRLLAAVLVAAGQAAAGGFAGQGMARPRRQDRFVTVKGSAERVVDADLVAGPLAHTVGGNDLAGVQRELEANTRTIRDFFLEAGFRPEEIVVSSPRLQGRWSFAFGDQRPPERLRYSTPITLRTGRVAEARHALRRSGERVGRGVMLGSARHPGAGPESECTRLNDIKPALVAEATRNARVSAEQFAKDSGARLTCIRTANQGAVVIRDRDRRSPDVENVRAVTTAECFLRD